MSGVMHRPLERGPAALGLRRRPSPTTPPACTSCRACCSRCCSARRPGAGRCISVSLLDSMLAAQTQEAAAHLMRGQRGELGRHAALRRVRDLGRRARDGRRLQGRSARHDIGSALGIRASRQRPALRRFRAQVENKAALQAIFRERFATNTTAHWLARLEAQDLLCAPGAHAWPRRWPTSRHAINGMILEADGRGRGDARGRLAHPPDGRAGRRCASRRRSSASTRTRCWPSSAAQQLAGRMMPSCFDVRDHVARVTIDRPEVMNAVDAATEAELQRIWTAIEADRDIRAVVLTGAGEPRLLRRRGHEGRQRRHRAGILGRSRVRAASAASRCATRSTCR